MAAAVAVDPEGAVEAGATQGAVGVAELVAPAGVGLHPDRAEAGATQEAAEGEDDPAAGAVVREVAEEEVVVVDRRRVRRQAGLRE